jgi:hypothetical protein
LRIEVKSGARLGMSKQALNRLYVFALADEKGRKVAKAVAEVVEAESLIGFEPNANLNGGGANFIAAIMLALRGVPPFIFVEGKIQSSGFA